MNEEPAPSHYAALQLEPTASTDEVRRAYRGLVQRHHPDRPDAQDEGVAMARINLAYEVLSDAHRRAEYDAWRRPASAPPPSSSRRKADLRQYSLQEPGGTARRLAWAVPLGLVLVLGLGALGWYLLSRMGAGPSRAAVPPVADDGTLRLTPARTLQSKPQPRDAQAAGR